MRKRDLAGAILVTVMLPASVIIMLGASYWHWQLWIFLFACVSIGAIARIWRDALRRPH